jgi:hypothetical protein
MYRHLSPQTPTGAFRLQASESIALFRLIFLDLTADFALGALTPLLALINPFIRKGQATISIQKLFVSD